MASIVLGASFNMLAPPTWNGSLQYSNLVAGGGGEFAILKDGTLSPGWYTQNDIVRAVQVGADAVIYRTDNFAASDKKVELVRWFDDGQEVLPDETLIPAAALISDFSVLEGDFRSYFEAGQQSQFLQSILGGNDLVFGSNYDDLIVGYGGSDVLDGGGGADTIFGGEGADLLTGGGGDDAINGGAGIDSARYIFGDPTTSGNYSITKSNTLDVWFVRQESSFQSKDEGLDTLAGVERLVFSDVNVALDIDGTSAVAYRLYKAAFDRVPDLAGLGFWIASMDIGVTGLEVAQGFINSPEFLAMYGADSSNADFVDRLYLNILDRPGETEGRSYWINALDNGADRAAILLDFSESVENQTNVQALISNGIEYTPFVFG